LRQQKYGFTSELAAAAGDPNSPLPLVIGTRHCRR
jgi:hypothetical protein